MSGEIHFAVLPSVTPAGAVNVAFATLRLVPETVATNARGAVVRTRSVPSAP